MLGKMDVGGTVVVQSVAH